jgi:hypothetical protein
MKAKLVRTSLERDHGRETVVDAEGEAVLEGSAGSGAGSGAGEGEEEAGPGGALLQYLDRRQNEVLLELDRLSDRIESLIGQIQRERDGSHAA